MLKKLLNERLAKESHRPVIVLSLNDYTQEDILYVKKPVKTDDMLSALSRARDMLYEKTRPAVSHQVFSVEKEPNYNSPLPTPNNPTESRPCYR